MELQRHLLAEFTHSSLIGVFFMETLVLEVSKGRDFEEF